MALHPLSRPKALIVMVNTLIGAVALAVVALVKPANETVRDWLAEIGAPFGVVMLIATALVVMWTVIGLWSLSKNRATAP